MGDSLWLGQSVGDVGSGNGIYKNCLKWLFRVHSFFEGYLTQPKYREEDHGPASK